VAVAMGDVNIDWLELAAKVFEKYETEPAKDFKEQ
jgi:hypothetical protein